MPLLAETPTTQPSFQSFSCSFRAQTHFHGKGFLSSLNFWNEKGLSFSRKSLTLPKIVKLNVRQVEISAVATLEPKSLPQNENGHLGYHDSERKFAHDLGVDLSSSSFKLDSSSEDSKELDERETLRRMRISKANKGNTPWNKGRKHSAETLQRIRERTRLAMQDPKVKMKLVKLGHAQSKETRMKIGVGVRIGWQRRREKLMVQETCHYEWQNLIAEASRRGYGGEDELHWDSYKTVDEELKEKWLESVEQRKKTPRLSGSRRAPKSADQRRKISEAISAKWADPEYRERVCSALTKYHGTPVGVGGKLPRKTTTPSPTRSPSKRKVSDSENSSSRKGIKIRSPQPRFRKSNAPQFKDPLASSKLEMIKSIRANRASAETQKTEAIVRARLLISEAEKAAKALEVAALKSPIARASLIETRKLISEAIQSIESIEIGQTISPQNGKPNSLASHDLHIPAEKEAKDAHEREVNGTQSLEISKDEDFDFSNFTLQDFPSSKGNQGTSFYTSIINHSHYQPNGNYESDKKPPLNGWTNIQRLEEEEEKEEEEETSFKSTTVAKRWVRGKLIEVAEES